MPRAQRKQPGTLADCLRRHGGDRDAALVEGYRELGLMLTPGTVGFRAVDWGYARSFFSRLG